MRKAFLLSILLLAAVLAKAQPFQTVEDAFHRSVYLVQPSDFSPEAVKIKAGGRVRWLSRKGLSLYQKGRYAEAGSKYESAFKASGHRSSLCLYNSAVCAYLNGDIKRSRSIFEQCLERGFYGPAGEVYTMLSQLSERGGISAAGLKKSREYLLEGLSRFPESKEMILKLVNNASKGAEDPGTMLPFVEKALKAVTDNASLLYLRGDLLLRLGRTEEASSQFKDCAERFPDFEGGYAGLGRIRAKEADEICTKMVQADDATFTRLLEQRIEVIRQGIETFSKALSVSKDPVLRHGSATGLAAFETLLRGLK
jgi:tetratricopeptide (TPR) repeat protein